MDPYPKPIRWPCGSHNNKHDTRKHILCGACMVGRHCNVSARGYGDGFGMRMPKAETVKALLKLSLPFFHNFWHI